MRHFFQHKNSQNLRLILLKTSIFFPDSLIAKTLEFWSSYICTHTETYSLRFAFFTSASSSGFPLSLAAYTICYIRIRVSYQVTLGHCPTSVNFCTAFPFLSCQLLFWWEEQLNRHRVQVRIV